MKKVCIVYDNKLGGRNDGTAFLCWNALRKISKREAKYVSNEHEKFELKFYLPPDGISSPKEELKWGDYNLTVDWGADCFNCDTYVPPSPNAVYWVDSHLGKEYRIKEGLKFDKVYLAQLNDVEVFKQAGCKDVEWLPLAAEPDLWRPVPQVKHYDVAFIGFLNCEKRMDYLERLFKAFPEFFYGVRFFDPANEIFNQSKLLFNISIKDDVNMRFFEAMSTGVPLLTNRIYNNGMETLATEGEHYIGYSNEDEMISQAKWILDNYEKAKQIGESAAAHIRSTATYEHRMKKVLEKGGIL